MINKGTKVPLTTKIPNTSLTLSDLFKDNNYLVLYFYPADGTPTCTTQACAFRDYTDALEHDFGVRVIGVSKDSLKSHEKFKNKHELGFDLISDADLQLHNIFGTWGEKSLFGRKYMGTLRTTFLINKKGEIIEIWGTEENPVKAKEQGKDVYEYLKQKLEVRS